MRLSGIFGFSVEDSDDDEPLIPCKPKTPNTHNTHTHNTHTHPTRVRVVTWNVAGLKRNWAQIIHLTRNFDVLVLQETLVHPDALPLPPPGFRWIRQTPSSFKNGRGIAALVSKTFASRKLTQTTNNEILGFTLGHEHVIITGYNRPKTSAVLDDLAALIRRHDSKKVIALGDWNSRHTSWDPILKHSHKEGNILRRCLLSLGADVLNPRQPTCVRPQGRSTVDLLIANGHALLDRTLDPTATVSGGGGSDHCPVSISFGYTARVAANKPLLRTRTTRRTEWGKVETAGETLWSEWCAMRDKSDSPTSAVAQLTQALTKIHSDHSRTTTHHMLSQTSPPWWDPALEKLILEQRLTWNQISSAHDAQDWEEANRLEANRQKLGRLIAAKTQKAQWAHWNSTCKKIAKFKHDSQRWSEYRKATKASTKSLAPLHLYDRDGTYRGTRHTDVDVAEEIANTMARRHTSDHSTYKGPPSRRRLVTETVRNFVHSARRKLHDSGCRYIDAVPPDAKPVTPQDIITAIKKLGTNKARGNDGVSAKLIKTLKKPLARVLADLANWSLATAHWPKSWKHALVKPLAKKDVPASGDDFRPVSLLPLLSKLVESAIETQLQEWMTEEDVIPREQDGFRVGCDGHLERVYSEAREAISQKQASALLLFDVAGAFDRVWHDGLLYKLLLLDAPRHITLWVSHYLEARTYQTVVGDHKSNPWTATRGVPQGAVLSPALWNLYISDIIRNTEVSMLLFADDVAMQIRLSNGPPLKHELAEIERRVEALHGYCKEWWLELAIDKTQLLIFSNSTKTIAAWGKARIGSGEAQIKTVASAKYLGVTFDSRLTFATHINRAIERASRRLRHLTRHGSRTQETPLRFQVLLYQLCVRSILEYGSHVYAMASHSQLTRLDKFQARALKRLLRVHATSSDAAVEVYCNCEPLKLRRWAKLATLALRRPEEIAARSRTSSRRHSLHKVAMAEAHTIALNNLGLPQDAVLKDLWTEMKEVEGIDSLNTLIENPTEESLLPQHMPNINKKSPQSVAAAIEWYHDTLDAFPGNRPHMYVDGSLANGKSGIGVFISTPARSEYYALPLDDQMCNVRAEALALRLAAILIDQHADLRQAIVISDCRPALTQADKHIGIGARTGSLLRKNKAKALWCPSHVGIPGNEIADQLAYQASTDKADDSAKLLQDRGIPISSLPANAYRDTRWWKKKCSAALTLKWNKTWNDMKTSLHKWKPTIGPWKSKLTSRLKADLLLAKLRLNRHPLQGTPGQQRPACRCGAHTLSYTHTISQCPLWTQQRNALLDDTRRALENPDISMQTLPDTLLQSHKKAFHEWKLADLLCEFLSNTAGA